MKKILSIMVMFVLSLSLFSLTVMAQDDVIRNDKTGIPDKGLYKSILWNLGKKGKGTFTKKEAAKIEKLNASSSEIKSLKGIKHLKNLQDLAIGDNKLTKLTYIGGLKKLKYLYVSSNKLRNLNDIKKLKNLRYLWAAHNKLTDISGIKGLTKLKGLQVQYNRLTKLPNLTKSKIRGVDYSDFTFNKLSKKQLERKLPKTITKWKGFNRSSWFKDQVVLQNIDKTIILDTPKSLDEITTTTRTISGTAHKNGYVAITLDLGDREGIYVVRVDGNGKFVFKDLSLEEYEGQELTIFSAYVCYEASQPIFAKKSFVVKKD